MKRKSDKIILSDELLRQWHELVNVNWLRKKTSDAHLHAVYNEFKWKVRYNIIKETIASNNKAINQAKNGIKYAHKPFHIKIEKWYEFHSTG